jgi:peptide/nickel transport system permease protein
VGAYLGRRLIQLPLVLLVISLMVFGLMHVSKGDPISIMLGSSTSPELEAQIRAQYRLDRPLPEQYVFWIGRILLHGDLGNSIRTGEPVLKMILDRLPTTMTVTLLAISLALAIAMPVGIISAYHRGAPADYISMSLAMLGLSIPNFVLAIFLILFLSVGIDWLPTSGWRAPWEEPGQSWRYLIMPVIALAVTRTALLARLLRSSILEVLNRDFVRTAQAKGLSRSVVMLRHVLRNGLLPMITATAISFAYLLGGQIVIEQIFALPGVGNLLLTAVTARDFPVIQGVTLFIAMVFIVSNLIADVLYTVFDPRITYR